jgi:hypothetical protein
MPTNLLTPFQRRRIRRCTPLRRLRSFLTGFVVATLCCTRGSKSTFPTGPDDEPLLAWLAPTLDDEPVPLVVPTYEGTGQSVHPDVVAFVEQWNGARLWMTITPYPNDDVKFENPSVLVSDDGYELAVPQGVTNPVISSPGLPAYNSDPDLTYDRERGELVMSYRVVKDGFNTIKVVTSRDGRTWSSPRIAFSERSHSAVSQSIVPATRTATAMAWYVDAGPTGCKAQSTRVLMRRATTPNTSLGITEWSGSTVTDLAQPGYNIWHLKVRYIPSKREYWALLVAYPADGNGCGADDLFLAHSKDGIHWMGFPRPLLYHGDRAWTRSALYRGSFLYDPETDRLSMWFSARSEAGIWRIGFARFVYHDLMTQLSLAPAFSRGLDVPRREVWFDAP